MKPLFAFLFFLTVSVGAFSQGSFWGATYNVYGGDGGRIYRFSPDGSDPVLVKTLQQYDLDGSEPFESPLILGSDNMLYGGSRNGGKYQSGVIFSINPATFEYKKIYDFKFLPGWSGIPGLNGPLTEGPDGFLYGFEDYGEWIFKVKKDGTAYQRLNPERLDTPYDGGLTFGADGNLYGVTETSSTAFPARMFRITPSGTVTTVVTFTSGQSGAGGIIKASNGKLYGCYFHVNTNASTVYSVDEDGQNFTTYSIPDGRINRIIEGPGSKIYGTVSGLTGNKSGLFEISLTGTGYSLLHQFDAGREALGALAVSGNVIFGTTRNEDDPDANIIYRFDTGTDDYSVVSEIPESDGTMPTGVTLGLNNVLFVTNQSGGTLDVGSVVKVKTDGSQFRKIKDFWIPNDGTVVGMRLGQLPGGEVIGVTAAGGDHGNGVFFKIDKNDEYHTLFHFDTDDGIQPFDVPIPGPDAFYYGTTSAGGANGLGTIYRIKGDGSGFQKLFDFTAESGYAPNQGLTLANGRLYGLTGAGGDEDMGTIFGINPNGSGFEKLLDFDDTNGSYPYLSVMSFGGDGFLYGSTGDGGAGSHGLVFKIKPDGSQFSVIMDFGSTEFAFPGGVPFIKEDGDLLVVATRGGTADRGGIFNVKADGSGGELIHEYDVTLPDANTIFNGHLTLGPDGKLWGVEPNGGEHGTGTVFRMKDDGSDYTTFDLGLDTNPIGYMMPWHGLLYVEPAGQVAQTINFPEPSAPTLSDETFELNATASSGLPVTYTTTSEKISIAGNVVTMMSAGRVSITANQEGNESYFAATPVEQDFCINPPKPVISFGGTTAFPVLTSSNATGNQWYREGLPVFNATGTVFEVIQNGVYTVTTTVEDCESAPSAEMTVTIVGLSEEAEASIKVYPNPAADEIFLSTGGESVVTMVDVVGRVIDQRAAGPNEVRYDVRSLGKGIYFFRISMENKVIIRSFAKL